MDHVYIESKTLTYGLIAIIIDLIGYLMVIIHLVLDCMYLVLAMTCCTIYKACLITSCVSILNSTKHSQVFGNVIAMICSGTSYVDHFIDIYTICIHNAIMKSIYVYFQEMIISIITIFIQIFMILVNCNAIVIMIGFNNDNYKQYYKVIYGYSLSIIRIYLSIKSSEATHFIVFQ